MKVLELFAGTESIGKVFREAGHEVFSVDANTKFGCDLSKDIMTITIDDIPFKPDIIWASPPCPTFSTMSISTHWDSQGRPKTANAVRGMGNVLATLDIIKQLKPKYYFIENPVGMLRKMAFMQDHNRVTVTYCQYGENYRKPTDIFTNLEGWKGKKCRNGATCHESAPRTTSCINRTERKGVQRLKDNHERAIIPKQLVEEILRVCESGPKTMKQQRLV